MIFEIKIDFSIICVDMIEIYSIKNGSLSTFSKNFGVLCDYICKKLILDKLQLTLYAKVTFAIILIMK